MLFIDEHKVVKLFLVGRFKPKFSWFPFYMPHNILQCSVSAEREKAGVKGEKNKQPERMPV